MAIWPCMPLWYRLLLKDTITIKQIYLILGRDGTFLCPVTGSRHWSADLGAGRFVLGGGLAHRKCLGFARKGSLSCSQCCHLVSAELAMCLPSYYTHCFVIGQAEALKSSYTLMMVYVQRMVRGRHMCGKPFGKQHSRMSGGWQFTLLSLSWCLHTVWFGLGWFWTSEVSQSKVIALWIMIVCTRLAPFIRAKCFACILG